MIQGEIAAVLADHVRWLRGEGGKRAVLTRTVLTRTDLTCARLSGADLSGADLSGADLSGADLTGADLTGADLTGADLTGTVLTRTDLTGARLTGADLTGAGLTGARLTGADLSGARLSGADLSGATVNRLLRRATRADGYEFSLWDCQEGFFIAAGCRWFTLAKARQHWTATRGWTPLGYESLDILDFFAAAITRTEKET
jgi:hypothetical protein